MNFQNRGVRVPVALAVAAMLLANACCTCRKKPYANMAEFDRARERAVKVADTIMAAIVRFEEVSPERTDIEWDLEKIRAQGYRVSFQNGFLTLKKSWKRWDLYFVSLGQCFSPRLEDKGKRLVVVVKRFPPPPDDVIVIIDHGSYAMDLMEDRLYDWYWYLKPWDSASESISRVDGPDEVLLQETTKGDMQKCR